MLPRYLLILACDLFFTLGLHANQLKAEQGALTTCAQVRDLSTLEASQGIPVRIQGVVTLAPAQGTGGFTLDDGTGIWVARPREGETSARPQNLDPGDWVEIKGATQAGHFLPIVTATEVTRLGRKALPAPTLIGQLDLKNGALDGQRVLAHGVIQAAENVIRGDRKELRLVVSIDGTRFNYTAFDAPNLDPEKLVDAEVEVGGVFLAYFNARRQFLGVRIRSNNVNEFKIVRAAPINPFSAPEVTLSDGMLFSAKGGSPHRRLVRGSITYCRPGHFFILQEGKHALRVNTRSKELLQPGDIVEAAGFFSLEHHKAEMLDAIFRRTGQSPAASTQEISSELLFTTKPGSTTYLSLDFDDYLISLRGRLVSIDGIESNTLRLNLACDGHLISAEVASSAAARQLAGLRIGSELRISGVCELTFSESQPVVEWPLPISARLLMRGVNDVEVITAASWWTPERLWLALGIFGVVLAAALAWAALLRRKVAVRSRELAEAMRERRDAAVDFESTLRERNRLAADLHDTLEQSLTGIALQLEVSEALQSKERERSQQHMILAKQVLDRSREDLRRSIWNLRANPLEAANLIEALREIAASRSAGIGVRIVVQSRGETRPLPDFVAGNLLMLVQEGITNIIKHAKAREIQIEVEFYAHSITLEIKDDGIGFDVQHVDGPKQGHFGLQGMRERINRLSGQFQIDSRPGEGTRIRAAIPE